MKPNRFTIIFPRDNQGAVSRSLRLWKSLALAKRQSNKNSFWQTDRLVCQNKNVIACEMHVVAVWHNLYVVIWIYINTMNYTAKYKFELAIVWVQRKCNKKATWNSIFLLKTLIKKFLQLILKLKLYFQTSAFEEKKDTGHLI